MPTKIPLSPDEVTSSWLTQALHRSGRLHSGAAAEVIDIQPLSAGTAYSTLMYRIKIAAPGLPESAILKLSVDGPARQILDNIGAYAREVAFYRDLGGELPVRIPQAYVAEFDAKTNDMILLIEDLAPLAPVDQTVGLTLAQAEAAVDGLARYHAWSWQHPRLATFADRFPPLSGARGRGIIEQFGQFMGMVWPAAIQISGAGMSPEVAAFGQRLPALIPFFLDRLSAPATIIHGELRGENLFFDHDGSLILIDFQVVTQGCGLIDVAYLLSQSLPTELRRGQDERLVRRYWNGLVAGGVADYAWQQAWEQYRLAVAYNLILPGVAFTAYEASDQRGKTLLLKMLSRASAAIADNDSLTIIPK